MVGDKLVTTHGLKFTVGEIIAHAEMPSMVTANEKSSRNGHGLLHEDLRLRLQDHPLRRRHAPHPRPRSAPG